MIFADKLIQLRKKAGWSQEELAEQMDVTRQSVSKWEGAQSIPDLNKIIRLSELFGVSTDYLMKDNIEDLEISTSFDEISPLRCVSMEEANDFLSIKTRTAKSTALATFLCILSPICLLLLGAISENPKYGLSENVAGGIGVIILLLIIAIAVAIFISSNKLTEPFDYLDKEIFETAYGVSGMVSERKSQYNKTHTKDTIIGVSFCITSPIPLFIGAITDEKNDLLLTIMLSISLFIVGIGVFFLVNSSTIWESFEKLLQEGNYSKAKKEKRTASATISSIYWAIVTAIYLGYSLVTNKWGYSWIIWVVAAVLLSCYDWNSQFIYGRKIRI